MKAVKAASARAGDGRRTRDEILSYAVQLASREGLEALTIGRLAEALSLSKSGLFAHFGSKEELQLAVLERASEVFAERVVRVGRRFDPGLTRLAALLEAWLAYLEARDFEGGCFFAAASAEFDGRPGRVREAVVRLASSWLAALDAEVRKAQARGDLHESSDPAQLIYELHALVHESNWAMQLFDDRKALDRARAGVRVRLAAAATETGRALLHVLGRTLREQVRGARSELAALQPQAVSA